MPSPELHASVDVIRREAELAVAASSLRAVADEVHLSPMGLRAFIRAENTPQDRTVRKLNTWYAARVSARGDAGEHEARVLLALLLGFYPQADHARVQRNFLDQMEREFRASEMAPPPWLATLTGALRRDGDAPGPARG